jgi:hypothetical protein
VSHSAGQVRLAGVFLCLVTALSLTATRQTVQTESVLLSHWELDEGSGTTTVDSVDGGSGTLRNGATWVAGRSGSAVNLDGVDDYIELPGLEVTGRAITLAAWVKTSSFSNGVNQRFIAKAVDDTEQRAYWVLGHVNNGRIGSLSASEPVDRRRPWRPRRGLCL